MASENYVEKMESDLDSNKLNDSLPSLNSFKGVALENIFPETSPPKKRQKTFHPIENGLPQGETFIHPIPTIELPTNKLPIVYAPLKKQWPIEIWHWSRDEYTGIHFDDLHAMLVDAMERIHVRFHNVEVDGSTRAIQDQHRLKFLNAIGRCHKLNYIGIKAQWNSQEIQLLIQSLGTLLANGVLEEVRLYEALIGDIGVQTLCKMLADNHSFKRLVLHGANVSAFGAASIEAMLMVNSTIEELSLELNPLGPDGMESLLRPLTGNIGNPPTNMSIKHLTIGENNIGSRGAKAIAEMLRTNKTLKQLKLQCENSIGPDDVCMILESLHENKSMTHLDLSFCNAVQGDEVLIGIMDLLQVNPWLEDINMENTPLEREGYSLHVKAQLQKNKQEHIMVMRDMPKGQPSSARVFLCGHAFSGKTTLTKSMVRNIVVQGFCAKFCTPLMEVIEQRKPFDFCFNDPNGWETRTRGIDVNILVNDDDRKISIWDLAGQEEYHAFHDMMIPDLSSQGNPCFFLVVCNPFHMRSNGKKSLEEIQEEISYWLRFIASNTKRLSNFQSQVAIVMTHEDKTYGEIQHVENIVLILKDKFAKFINLSSKLHYVNAHSSLATKDVTNEVIKSCMGILDTLPDAFLVCSKMRLALGEWNKEHPDQPIVTMETFNNDIIDKKVPNLRLSIDHNQQGLQQEMHKIRNVVAKSLKEKARIAVAKSLHDAGEIIYFEDEDFVVVNPNWFCHKVMGRLIKLRKHVTTNNLTTTFKHGIGRREQIEDLLNISLKKTIQYDGNNSRDITKHLICLMLKMNLAYEIHPTRSDSQRSSIFVPTTLQFDDGVANGARRLQWKTTFPQEAEIIYIGRRLQCCDQELTTLTPGFFPKLQVKLHNYFANLLATHGICENEQNLVKIWIDGLEILVELSGHMMGHIFIDILVKSSKSSFEILSLVDAHVVRQIENLCSDAHGCQGVALVKGILRPKCVERLLLCKNRKDQVVLVENLKQELLAANLDSSYVHPWGEVDVGEEDVDYLGKSMDDSATSLLGAIDTKDVFERRFQNLKELENDVNNLKLNSNEIKASSENKIEASSSEINYSHQSCDHNSEPKFSSAIASSSQGSLSLEEDPNLDLQLKSKSFQTHLFMKLDRLEKHIHKMGDKVVAEVMEGTKQEIKSMEKRLQEVMEKTREEIGCLEKRLHHKLVSKLDAIINLSLQLQQRQVPCNVFFTTVGAHHQRKLIVSEMLMMPGMFKRVHLHLLCEHLQGIHVVENQVGDVVLLTSSARAQEIAPLAIRGLRIFSLLLKVGAHFAAGIGDMVPDLGKGVALALDTQCLSNFLPDFGSSSSGSSSSMSSQRRDPGRRRTPNPSPNPSGTEEEGTSSGSDAFLRGRTPLPSKEAAMRIANENIAAEQWLVNFLKGKDISKLFGLSRVQYRNVQRRSKAELGPPIRWVCNRHRQEGIDDGSLVDCPVQPT